MIKKSIKAYPWYFSSFGSSRKPWLCFIFILLALLGSALPLYANEPTFKDHNLKAVYLFRFAFLTNWGDTLFDEQGYTFCAEISSEVSKTLQALIQKKPQKARFLPLNTDKLTENANCNIIYLTQQDTSTISILKQKMPHTLLIGEGETFIQHGGMIAFIKINNRIKPLVHLSHIAATGLSLRSQLLSVSEVVTEEAQ